jgi:hypothetical protein
MIVGSFLDGLKRTVSAPTVLVSLFVVTFAMSVPLAITVRGMLQEHLDASVAAESAADGVNYDWWQEFMSQAAGLATTFTPAVVGFGAVLHNVSNVLDGEAPIAPVAGALAAYLVVWTFAMGGVIDRYARQRPTRAHGFFAAGGVFFGRFLRLAAIAGVVYWFLFTYVHRWLFDNWYTTLTRDLAVERQAFGWRVLMYVIFGVLLVATNVVFDYAKIRAVVEDRRSMLGALIASARFIARNPGRVLALYALNTAAFLVTIGLWALVAPGVGGAGLAMWLAFALAQVYIAVRLFLKLHVLASQTALFQASLAHASYTAVPPPVWPESPAAEMIRG